MNATTSALDPELLLADLLTRARKAGAQAADALLVEGTSLSLARRLGKSEGIERAEGRDLGLRVLMGQRQAVVSSTDFSSDALQEMVNRAVAMATAAPEDPYCGIADPADIARSIPELDIYDPAEPSPEVLEQRAAVAEDAARAVPGVTNSEGAESGWSSSRVHLAASNGFSGGYAVSRHSFSVSVLAGSGTEMERDYDFTSAISGADLKDPAALGRSAGERAVRRLHPRKVATAQVPVVYDPRVSGGLIGSFAGAVNGASIARGTSFLKDRMGQRVFAPGIEIIDDPLRRKGLRSKPFDGEGLPTRRRAVIEDGVLTGWFLDLATARQLRLTSTGNASRGTGAPPSPGADQPLSRGRRADRRRADRRHQAGLLRHRADRHGHQSGDRRLFARRRRILDRERRDRLPGQRSDRGRQPQGHVRAAGPGERPGIPLRHRRADRAHRRHDRGRQIAARGSRGRSWRQVNAPWPGPAALVGSTAAML